MSEDPVRGRPESHRYGIVLAIALVAIVFLIVAPESPWSRAAGLLFASAMLLAVLTTSGGRERAALGAGVVVVPLALAVAVGLELIPQALGSSLVVVLVVTTLVLLVRGLVRMLRGEGVTIQAVAGALAVYLLLGIVYAFAVSALAKIGGGFYFAQHTDGTESQHVYFSFTTMTTTGFGDYTPATRTGRALAVIEMLTGQIYLVTVIALLVGNLRRRGEAR